MQIIPTCSEFGFPLYFEQIHYIPAWAKVLHKRNPIFSTKVHKLDMFYPGLKVDPTTGRIDTVLGWPQVKNLKRKSKVFYNRTYNEFSFYEIIFQGQFSFFHYGRRGRTQKGLRNPKEHPKLFKYHLKETLIQSRRPPGGTTPIPCECPCLQPNTFGPEQR